MKKLLFILMLMPLLGKGQTFSNVGSPMQRSNYTGGVSVVKYLQIPAGNGVPAAIASWWTFINGAKAGNIYLDSTNNVLYFHNGTNWQFSTTLDTTVFRKSGGNGYATTSRIGIGTSTPSAKLDVTSTTSGVLFPRMTTAQRNALTAVEALLIYNLDTHKFNYYDGTAWQQVSSILVP